MSKLLQTKPPADLREIRLRIPKPIYRLTVDEPDVRYIVLVVRTDDDGLTRARIVLPVFQELPAGWDGPHEMHIAVPLADIYAHEYGYHAMSDRDRHRIVTAMAGCMGQSGKGAREWHLSGRSE